MAGSGRSVLRATPTWSRTSAAAVASSSAATTHNTRKHTTKINATKTYIQSSSSVEQILPSLHRNRVGGLTDTVTKVTEDGLDVLKVAMGVSLTNSTSDLPTALAKARQSYSDSTILIEAAVQDTMVVDVAVMEDPTMSSNGDLLVSPCGLRQNFKHNTASSASTNTDPPSPKENQNQGDVPSWAVPAPGVPDDVVVKMQALAKHVFRVVRATGFLRVNFFYVTPTGTVLINDINTMPSLTRGCMWFKLWAEAGIAAEEWVRLVVERALRRGKVMQRNPALTER